MFVDSVAGSSMNGWIVSITLNGCILPLKTDTGVQTNVLCENDYKLFSGVKLLKSLEKLRGYTGQSLDILGKCCLSVRQNAKQSKAVFYVYHGAAHSLLGLVLSKKIGVNETHMQVNQEIDENKCRW